MLLKALELDPNNTRAMSILGLIKNNSDPQMALDLFTRVRELDPESSFVYRQISFALRALDRLDDAEAILEEGIERFPEHPVLLSDVTGINLGTHSRPDEAAPCASRIADADSQNIIGLRSIAEIWLAVGNLDRSRDWLAVHADRFVGSQDVALTRYCIEIRVGNPEAVRNSIENTPQSPNFRFDRFGSAVRASSLAMPSA